MAEESSRGFRRFMLDPKSSVMNYIADNIPAEHLSHQQGSNGRVQQHGPANGQQANVQEANGFQQNQGPSHNTQNQAQDGFMHSNLPHRPSQVNSQSSSPRPGYAQPVQSSQLPLTAPYIASNLGHTHHGMDGSAGAQSQFPSSQSVSNPSLAQEPTTQQDRYSTIQDGGKSTATTGQGPPEPGTRRKNSPQSAPRLYHRMVLQYEITKKAFFAAKSQHNTQEMTSAAYELESSSRRIWALRYEHSWEFEGHSEAGHQAMLSKWQAEYEMWADTVLDIQDGQVLADAAYSSKYGDTSTHKETGQWDLRSRQDQWGYQNEETPQHIAPEPMRPDQGPPHTPQQMPPQQHISPQQQISSPQQIPQQQQFSPSQQIPQIQNLSMGQSAPQPQSMQDGQLPQTFPPGSFPQSGPPPTFFDQGMPPQQRQQSPQPPQIPVAQTPPPTMQNGQNTQPSPFNGTPNKQNIPAAPVPNRQQPQNVQSGQSPNMQQGQSRPPQQYMQQNHGVPSGSTPNLQQQQNMVAGQQGPPRNGIPPGQTMIQGQNMGPRQNVSLRPGPQIPPSLQAGGQMQGNGRQ